MGKKNQKKNKQGKAKGDAQEEQQNEVEEKPQSVDTQTATQEEVSNEPQMTAEERVAVYKKTQQEVYDSYLQRFKEEEIYVSNEPSILENQRNLEKLEKEEVKKLDKVFKKECQEVQDVYDSGAKGEARFKALRERIQKTLKEVGRQEANAGKGAALAGKAEKALAEVKQETQKMNNKRGMLKNMCQMLLDKSADSYMKYQKTIEEEQTRRGEISVQFQERLKEVTSELEVQKEKKQEEFAENQEWRRKIQELINEYKAKEEAFQREMGEFRAEIEKHQEQNSKELQEKLGGLFKEVEKERNEFVKIQENIKELSDKIQGQVKKFDGLKDTMTANNKKFEEHQNEIINKKTQIQTLESEIETMRLLKNREDNIQQVIQSERQKLEQQIKMLSDLSNALQVQRSTLQDSNKENSSTAQN